MTDAQFQQLLQHIDRIGNDIFCFIFLAIVMWIAMFIDGITRK